jgi:hypothetical protein
MTHATENNIFIVKSRCGGGKTNEALKNIKPYTIYAVPTILLFDSIKQRAKQDFIAVNSENAGTTVTRELVALVVKEEKYILCTHDGVSRLLDQNVDLSMYNLIIDEQPDVVEIFAHAYTDSDAQYVRGLVRTNNDTVTSAEAEKALKKKIEDIETGKSTNTGMLSLYRGLYGATYDKDGYALVLQVHDTSDSFALGVISCLNLVDISNNFKTATIMTADDIEKGIGCIMLKDGMQVPKWAEKLEHQYNGKITIIQMTDKEAISKTHMDKIQDGKTIREHMVDLCVQHNAKIMINNSFKHLVHEPLPAKSHGLNEWNESKAIGCVYAAKPNPLLAQALNKWSAKAKTAWVQTTEIDVIHQALARGNMRNNGDQICLVPDARSAEYIKSRCTNATIDLSQMIKTIETRGKGSKANVGKKKTKFGEILGDKSSSFNKWWSKQKAAKKLPEKDQLNPKHIKLANEFKKSGGRGATKLLKAR